ncbi:MAG: hypothetical protein ACOCP9_03175 [Halofilum sp. (in: g-proteobacteria)]
MRRVIVESPWAAGSEDERKRNIEYLREALRDCLIRGESPYASHGLLTAVLNDKHPEDRALGIEAGLVWGEAAHATVVYCDHGITGGMAAGIADAEDLGRPVEYRRLNDSDEKGD